MKPYRFTFRWLPPFKYGAHLGASCSLWIPTLMSGGRSGQPLSRVSYFRASFFFFECNLAVVFRLPKD